MTEYVTRESALRAIAHVDRFNGRGRFSEAVELLEPAPDLLESLLECEAGLASLLRSEGYSDHLFRVTPEGLYQSAREVLARAEAAIAKAEGRG